MRWPSFSKKVFSSGLMVVSVLVFVGCGISLPPDLRNGVDSTPNRSILRAEFFLARRA
jgi:hypothetical protein